MYGGGDWRSWTHFHAKIGGMIARIYIYIGKTNTNIIYAASFVCLLEDIHSKTLHFIYCPYRLYMRLYWYFGFLWAIYVFDFPLHVYTQINCNRATNTINITFPRTIYIDLWKCILKEMERNLKNMPVFVVQRKCSWLTITATDFKNRYGRVCETYCWIFRLWTIKVTNIYLPFTEKIFS